MSIDDQWHHIKDYLTKRDPNDTFIHSTFIEHLAWAWHYTRDLGKKKKALKKQSVNVHLTLLALQKWDKKLEITNCYNKEKHGRYGGREEGEKGFTEVIFWAGL